MFGRVFVLLFFLGAVYLGVAQAQLGGECKSYKSVLNGTMHSVLLPFLGLFCTGNCYKDIDCTSGSITVSSFETCCALPGRVSYFSFKTQDCRNW